MAKALQQLRKGTLSIPYSLHITASQSSCLLFKLLFALLLLTFPLSGDAIYSSVATLAPVSELGAHNEGRLFSSSRLKANGLGERPHEISVSSNQFRRSLQASSHSGSLEEGTEQKNAVRVPLETDRVDNFDAHQEAVDWHGQSGSQERGAVPAEQSLDLKKSFEAGGDATQEAFDMIYTPKNVSGGARGGGDRGQSAGSNTMTDSTVFLYSPQELEVLRTEGIDIDSPSACAQYLRIRQVAMMFLTKGHLFHEAIWDKWFQGAAGVFPYYSVLPEGCFGGRFGCDCNATRQELAEKLCRPRKSWNVLDNQHLYNVYVHPMPSFGTYPEESIFFGREIEERIKAEWGSHQLAEAAKNLMTRALQEPRNRKFILLSESDLPLYPPQAIHHQLLAEDKSRIDSCGAQMTYQQRITERMGMDVINHWRKSSQWFALLRKHALLIVDDVDFEGKFKKYCRSAFDEDYNKWRDCYSGITNPRKGDNSNHRSLIIDAANFRLVTCQETILHRLLAPELAFTFHDDEVMMMNAPDVKLRKLHSGDVDPSSGNLLGHETDCIGGLVSTDWRRGGSHPRSYKTSEVSVRLFNRLRNKGRKCDAQKLIREARRRYWSKSDNFEADICEDLNSVTPPKEPVVGYVCPLFARKFPVSASSKALEQLSSCENGLEILNIGCPGNFQRQPLQ